MRRALVLLFVLCGCASDFERQSQLTHTRVLAVRAEPAELAIDPTGSRPPEPVRFSVLAFAPGGAPQVELALCRPGNPYAADLNCPGDGGLPLPDGALSLLDEGVQRFLGSGAPTGGGGAGAALQQGFPLVIGYRATDGETEERGVYRLTVRATAAPNQNPTLEDVLVDGVPLGSAPLAANQEVVLTPVLAKGAQETFDGPDGPRVEPLSYSWHATGDGEVLQFRSAEPTEEQPALVASSKYRTPATAQRVTFYVVVRDGRGGTGWLVRDVEVR